MAKLTKLEYIQRTAEVLARAYGGTLKEAGTDVHMAKAVVRNLQKFLSFRVDTAESREKFNRWQKGRGEY